MNKMVLKRDNVEVSLRQKNRVKQRETDMLDSTSSLYGLRSAWQKKLRVMSEHI